MRTIQVTSQAEWDALPDSFEELTWVEIRAVEEIIIRINPKNSSVMAWDNSSVEARNKSSVVARENSSVVAWGNSSVVVWDNSSVEAWDNSSVEARNKSSVVARNKSSAVARDNSSVVALGNSSVVARDSSSVVALGNSSVEAWDSSSVVALGNSSVEAWEMSCAHLKSYYASVKAGDNATIYNHFSMDTTDNIESESTVNIINSTDFITPTFEQWLERGWVVADGIRQKLVSQKRTGEVTIYQTQDFKKKTFYVAQKGDKFAHGETIDQAKNDLRFKISDRNTSKYENWTENTIATIDEMIEAYMTITGACSTGVKMFCEKLKLKDKYEVREIFELTKGNFGHEEFKEFFSVESWNAS